MDANKRIGHDERVCERRKTEGSLSLKASQVKKFSLATLSTETKGN